MRNVVILLLYTAFMVSCSNTTSKLRIKTNIGSNWQFKLDTCSTWQRVNMPHTMHIEPLIVVNQFQGKCWYKKTFTAPDTAYQKVMFYFEGVMTQADVYINDVKIASHIGGYLPFWIDATSFVNPNASNEIKLCVSNEENAQIPPGKPLKELDFNYYGGIYRNVYLVCMHKIHITQAVNPSDIAQGGIWVNFNEISPSQAKGLIKVQVINELPHDKEISLCLQITDAYGKIIELKTKKESLKAFARKNIQAQLEIAMPKLWNIYEPNLYNLKVMVMAGKEVVDQDETTFGIRKAEIRADGFYLNDNKLYLNGTNRHQEYPYIGYALSDNAQRRDAIMIKNAGFDMVRLSHYSHSESFMQACDELGIVVMNSLPGWQFFGDSIFEENALQNLRDLIRRDRNHASVVFWENSLNETDMSDNFMARANAVLRAELPNANAITASWIDNSNYDLFIPARQHGKAPQYWNNYAQGNRKIFIAEYGDWEYYAQNAGFNQAQYANLKEEERTSRQLRAYGEKRLLQQALNFQEASNSNRKGKNTIGEANWLMFDYNRGYSADIECSGISDIFRIPKFAHYFYQSQRSASQHLPTGLQQGAMLHIASYWDHNSPLDVTIYSNCDSVALYLNKKLVAKQAPTINALSNELQQPTYIFKIDTFVAGLLHAQGFIDQQMVVEKRVNTPEKANNLILTLNTWGVDIGTSQPDVFMVYAHIIDSNQSLVHSANDEVIFKIEGKHAHIIGGTRVKAEAGIATILVRTEKFDSEIIISASAIGLGTATLKLEPK